MLTTLEEQQQSLQRANDRCNEVLREAVRIHKSLRNKFNYEHDYTKQFQFEAYISQLRGGDQAVKEYILFTWQHKIVRDLLKVLRVNSEDYIDACFADGQTLVFDTVEENCARFKLLNQHRCKLRFIQHIINILTKIQKDPKFLLRLVRDIYYAFHPEQAPKDKQAQDNGQAQMDEQTLDNNHAQEETAFSDALALTGDASQVNEESNQIETINDNDNDEWDDDEWDDDDWSEEFFEWSQRDINHMFELLDRNRTLATHIDELIARCPTEYFTYINKLVKRLEEIHTMDMLETDYQLNAEYDVMQKIFNALEMVVVFTSIDISDD